MSEYKVGDKVYLECEVESKDMFDNTYMLRYKNWLDGECLSTSFVSDDVLHPTDESYNKGLNDAWELAKKIVLSDGDGGYSCEELENIFGYRSPASIFKAFTPQKSLAIVKAYEDERNKITVGDVVKLKGTSYEAVVTRVSGTILHCLYKDGRCAPGCYKENYEKTGKHFDSIDEFMRSAD